MSSTKPLVKEALQMLNVCGMNPLSYNRWSNFKAAMAILVFIIFSLELTLTVVFIETDSDSMYDFAAIICIYQVLAKMWTLIVKRKQIAELLIVMEQLGQLNNSYTSPELKQRIRRIYNTINQARKYLVFISATFTLVTLISSFLYRKLPSRMYHLRNLSKTPDFQIALLFQALSLPVGQLAFYGCDYLFTTVIAYIYCEFQVIRERMMLFPQVEGSELSHELKSIVDQHNIILRCVNKVNLIYSPMMLNNVVLSVFVLSFDLVTINITDFANPFNFMKICALLVGNFIQVFAYCLGGTILTTACEEVANAVLESDWLLIQNPKLVRSLVLVIQRSQKLEQLKAGKLIDLNLQTCAKIVNSVYSFFTLFQAVYAKKSKCS